MRDFGGHLLHLLQWGKSGIVAQQLTSVATPAIELRL